MFFVCFVFAFAFALVATNCEETENNEIVNKDKTNEETDQEKAEIKMEDPVFLTLEYYRLVVRYTAWFSSIYF